MNFIIKHNYDIPPMLGYKYCYSKINFTATVLYTLFLYIGNEMTDKSTWNKKVASKEKDE